MEYLPLLPWHDEPLSTRRSGRTLRLVSSPGGTILWKQLAAPLSKHVSPGKPHFDASLQRRNGPYFDPDYLQPRYSPAAPRSPLPLCLYLHRRHCFIPLTCKQSNQHPRHHALPPRLADIPTPALPTMSPLLCINAAVFYLLYRRQLRGRFNIKRLPSIEESVKHKPFFRYTCSVLVLVAVAYIIAAATQIPLSIVALSGAILLLIGALFWKRTTLWNTGKQISWPIFGFIAGMFIVVQAVESTGRTAQFGQLLLHLSGGTDFGAVMVGTLGSALGTNLINNVPMAVVMTSSLRGIQHAPVAIQHGFIAATMFGCDLGPNLTTVGSLATVLWLLILRRRNIEVSGLDYFKVGIIVTPLMLVVGALAIWLLLI